MHSVFPKFFLLAIVLISASAIPVYTFAAHSTGTLLAVDSLGLEKARGATLLPNIQKPDPIFDKVAQVLLGLVGSLALLALVIGGIMYVTSLGDDTKTAKAKSIIKWALVGLALAILSFAILKTLASFVDGGGGGSCFSDCEKGCKGQPTCSTDCSIRCR